MYHSHTFEDFECVTMVYNIGFGYVYFMPTQSESNNTFNM